MTSVAGPDLWEFFGGGGATPGLPAAISGGSLAQLRVQLGGKVPPGFWSAAQSAIGDSFRQLLNVPVAQIAADGWNTYRSLQKYRDSTKYPPEEIALVPLKEHKITSSHKPRIDILVNDQVVGTIEFEIKLTLDVEMAVLKVQGGKIREVEAGNVTGTGTLMCGSAILFECKSEKIQLPGVISFGAGLPIALQVE